MLGRGWFLVPTLLVGLVVGGGIAAAVAHWDDDDDPRVVRVTAPSGDSTTAVPQVIEVHDRGERHWGFFPGFFLFPLIFFGLIWLVCGGVWRRGPHGGRPGGWGGHFEEWHRQQHAGDPTPPPAASA